MLLEVQLQEVAPSQARDRKSRVQGWVYTGRPSGQ